MRYAWRDDAFDASGVARLVRMIETDERQNFSTKQLI
jgi:hypothetical protein